MTDRRDGSFGQSRAQAVDSPRLTSRTPPHLPALDRVRGVAVLMVMWFHFWTAVAAPGLAPKFVYRTAVFGQMGVDLFFVLSGFLITRNLLASKGKPHYFRDFYVRRALRIFPLYFGALVLLFLVLPSLGLARRVPAAQQAWFWLYMQNVAFTFQIPAAGPNHFWSLAVEEHYYLVWPLLVLVLSSRRLLRASLAIIALAVVSRLIVLGLGFGVFYFTLCRMDALAAGSILAVLEQRGWGSVTARRFVMLGVTLAVSLGIVWTRVGAEGSPWVQVVKFTIIAAFFTCVVGFYAIRGGTRPMTASSAFLAFTGKISYGMYVLHPFVFSWLHDRSSHLSVVVLMVIGFALTYGAAYVSYRLYERPFLRFKRYFGSPASPPALIVGAGE